MKASVFYAVLGFGVILVIGIMWWGTHRNMPLKEAPTPTQATSTQPSESLSGLSIYTNGEYGFVVFYPASSTATTTFTSYYHVPSKWRMGALPNTIGTPIVAFVGYQRKSDTSYPRYFDTEVRIGVSTDPKEKSACLKVGDGEAPGKDLTLEGTTWKSFLFESAGMSQYVKGVSYRTLHNGNCFAMEQIQTGASYRDEQASTGDIPDAVLQQHYQDLAPIIQSFSFVQP
jgi:hypothetical protein